MLKTREFRRVFPSFPPHSHSLSQHQILWCHLCDLQTCFYRVILQDISSSTATSRPSPTTNEMLPDSLLTPSPEEQIIKQRGKKKCASSLDRWLSHENLVSCLKTPTNLKTPTKSTPKKCHNIPTRTSPRKRLNLGESLDSPMSSPNKQLKSKVKSQLVKRQRIQRKVHSKPEIETAIKGLAHTQLVEMILHLVGKHPELKEEIVCDMPCPDLKPLEEKLNSLSRNVYKSFPYTRWGSNRDAFCYRRVNTHLTAFKKECIDQGKLLGNSQHWTSVIDYVLLAWTYVHRLPDWDNPAHDKIKERCFSALASQCMAALEKGVFDQEHYEDMKERLEEAKASCEVIQPCITFVENKIKNLCLSSF